VRRFVKSCHFFADQRRNPVGIILEQTKREFYKRPDFARGNRFFYFDHIILSVPPDLRRPCVFSSSFLFPSAPCPVCLLREASGRFLRNLHRIATKPLCQHCKSKAWFSRLGRPTHRSENSPRAKTLHRRERANLRNDRFERPGSPEIRTNGCSILL